MSENKDMRLSIDECFFNDCHEAELFLDVLNPGDKIDGWVVTACVAFGGTSEVYRAVRENDKSCVASIKVLCDDQASARERFKYEVRILSESNTAALPRYIASGEVDGHPYVITEYLEPIDLPSEEKEIKRYLLGVCNCVQVLHAAGIVHRYIKPRSPSSAPMPASPAKPVAPPPASASASRTTQRSPLYSTPCDVFG